MYIILEKVVNQSIYLSGPHDRRLYLLYDSKMPCHNNSSRTFVRISKVISSCQGMRCRPVIEAKTK